MFVFIIYLADPMDRRLIRFNNCLQFTACLCNIVGCPGSDIVDCIADLVTACLMGCMTGMYSIYISHPPLIFFHTILTINNLICII